METINTTIFSLSKDLKEIEENISSELNELGNKLFINAAENGGIIDAKQVTDWKRLREERDFCSESILEIKTSNERLSELTNFKKQIIKTLGTNEKELKKNQDSLLFGLYTEEKNRVAGYIYSIAQNLKETEAQIDQINSEIEEYSEQKKSAGLLTKLNLNKNIFLKKTKISNLKKDIRKTLEDNAAQILGENGVKEICTSEEISDSLKEKYSKILTIETSANDAQKHLQAIEEETSFLNKKLQDLDALKNPRKKISTLSARIAELDGNIGNMQEKAAYGYAESFVLENGSTVPDSGSFAEYSSYIQNLAALRLKKTQTEYHIEYCKVQQQINSKKAKIASLNASIQKYSSGIKELENKIKNAENDIKNNNADCEQLEKKAAELFLKFGSGENAEENIAGETNV